MTIALVAASFEHLSVLAAGRTPSGLNATPEALPPPFVPQRTLGQLAQGKSPSWCCMFYVVHTGTGEVLGTCGFKDELQAGKVEVGYGIAPKHRGKGYATEALAQLIGRARALEPRVAVLAQINPDNRPSTRVAQKLGFVAGAAVVDFDGEQLLQWWWRGGISPSLAVRALAGRPRPLSERGACASKPSLRPQPSP